MGCYARFFEFYEGEHKRLSLQVNSLNRATDCKEPLDLTGVSAVSIELPATPDNLILDLISSPAVQIENAVLGKIYVDLTPTQIDQMNDGSIVVRVTDSSGKVHVAVASSASKKLTVPNC